MSLDQNKTKTPEYIEFKDFENQIELKIDSIILQNFNLKCQEGGKRIGQLISGKIVSSLNQICGNYKFTCHITIFPFGMKNLHISARRSKFSSQDGCFSKKYNFNVCKQSLLVNLCAIKIEKENLQPENKVLNDTQ